MGVLFYTDASGWLVAAMFVLNVCIGLFRRSSIEQHYAIGYGIAALGFLHASIAMDGLNLAGSQLGGIIVATLGMFVSWGQVGLGGRLKSSGGTSTAIRRFHLLTASILLVLGGWHLLINGEHVRALFGL